MEPYRTCEIRWFFLGGLPVQVLDWFARDMTGSEAPEPVAREDLYLLLKGRNDIGLKYRRDKIQLKLLGASEDVAVLSGTVAGRLGHWERHSWTYIKEEPGPGERLFRSRVRRRPSGGGEKPAGRSPMPMDSAGSVDCATAGKALTAPLVMEVTEVSFSDFAGWTLGIDAVGEPQATDDQLRAALPKLLADFPLLPLPKDQSFSYPQFLERCRDAP